MSENQQWEEADALLSGTSIKTARFGAPGPNQDKVPGTVHQGTVVAAQRRQATVYDPNDAEKDGKPKTWPNGEPVWELIVTIQTTEQDDDDDDGLRRVFVQGQMLQAVKAAVKEAKAPGLRQGGTLAILFERTERVPNSGYRRNVFRAKYTPPAPGSEADSVFSDAPAAPVHSEGQASMLDRLKNQRAHPTVSSRLQDTEPPF